MQIKVMQNLLKANDEKAEELRQLLKQHQVFMINLISSPGSGKTSLLESSINLLNQKFNLAVIEGDVETDHDAERLDHLEVPIASINTRGACHLESVSIEKAFSALNLQELDLVIVENVGNLVCPAEFDIGENCKVALLSTPEGDDKVFKYPLLFREAELVILNKIDLLAHSDFDKDRFYSNLSAVNPQAEVIEISCKTGFGIDNWVSWLVAAQRREVSV